MGDGYTLQNTDSSLQNYSYIILAISIHENGIPTCNWYAWAKLSWTCGFVK